jgi:tetratricopeptide (TPR) repeat protein
MAISFLEQGLKEARVSGDKRLISHGLQQLSLYFLMQGNTGIAKGLVDEAFSLTQVMGDKANIMGCHWLLATIALFSESYPTAEEHSIKAEQIARLQNDKQSLSISLKYLSLVSWAKSNYSRFKELTQEALLHAKERSDQFLVTELLVHLGEVYRLKGDLTQAKDIYKEALVILQQENFRSGYCICLEGIAALTITEGRNERAARLLGAREKLREITFVMDNSFVVDIYPFLLEQRRALIADTRSQLGDEAFLAAWQAGREMSLEQALDYMIECIR